MSKAADLRARSEDQISRYAKLLFDRERILRLAAERAEGGYTFLRLKQDHPYDYTRHEIAKALTGWLTAQGFRSEWRATTITGDPQRPDDSPSYDELVIHW